MRDYLEEFLINFGWEWVSGMAVDNLYLQYMDYCEKRKVQYFASRNGFARQMVNKFGFKVVRKRVNGERIKIFA